MNRRVLGTTDLFFAVRHTVRRRIQTRIVTSRRELAAESGSSQLNRTHTVSGAGIAAVQNWAVVKRHLISGETLAGETHAIAADSLLTANNGVNYFWLRRFRPEICKFRRNPGIFCVRNSEFRQNCAIPFLNNGRPLLKKEGGGLCPPPHPCQSITRKLPSRRPRFSADRCRRRPSSSGSYPLD